MGLWDLAMLLLAIAGGIITLSVLFVLWDNWSNRNRSKPYPPSWFDYPRSEDAGTPEDPDERSSFYGDAESGNSGWFNFRG